MIRNASKAIILRDAHVLLQKLRLPDGRIVYELPGGGQNTDETMEEAVIRECLEETGYTVQVERFAALFEEIITTEAFRERYPEHFHRMFHTFICRTDDTPPVPPSEADDMQIGFEWLSLSELSQIETWPLFLSSKLPEIVMAEHPLYLGSERRPSPMHV